MNFVPLRSFQASAGCLKNAAGTRAKQQMEQQCSILLGCPRAALSNLRNPGRLTTKREALSMLKRDNQMTPAGHSRLFAAVLMGAASINAAKSQVAFATTQDHDGIYAVDITTRQGDCDKAYHWKISVSGGHISSAGDTPMEASGQISGRGIVDFAFRRVGQVATVTGTLVRGAGSGTWSSPTMGCTGSWRALRQG
jgi:hypothetical protein